MLYQEEIYITIKKKKQKKNFFNKTKKLRKVTSVTYVNKLQNNEIHSSSLNLYYFL